MMLDDHATFLVGEPAQFLACCVADFLFAYCDWVLQPVLTQVLCVDCGSSWL